MTTGLGDAVGSRTLTLGGTAYPVVLPSVRDARLHVAAVIVTIHVLGQVALGFHVSVPQIVVAIVASAALEVAITFRSRRALVWPASAMLTGSGVALILRVPSTPVGAHWTFHGWYVFAGVSAFSLLTKYTLRHRGGHVFNPSNVGLVVAFLVLGSERAEPLDFWWSPLDGGMILAYAVIAVGGVLITRRIHLLAAAAAFWVSFAAGVGLLAASGHCMVARWAFAPVCDFEFWRVVVTSPEVLIFMFFMLTDPKTVPTGQGARIAFSVAVAAISTLLMAPQTNEFGTKVALLAGLVIACAARPVVAWLVASVRPTRTARWGISAVAFAAVAVAIVPAGAPARGVVAPAALDLLGRVPQDVDPATLPAISVDQDVVDWNHEIDGAGAREVVLALAENLEVERQAVQGRDANVLAAVDHGDRLDELTERVAAAGTTEPIVAERYDLDRVNISLIVPFGRQTGLSLGLEARGTVTTETFDPDGSVVSRESGPIEQTFVLGRPTGGRWMNVAVLAPGADASDL